MNKVALAFFFAVVGVAACGGKVAGEDGTLGRTSTPGDTPTASPTTTGAPAPTTTGPTTTPSGPIPAGEVGACGLYEGDRDTILASFGRARAIGIYEVASVTEECSGLGGTHVTFTRVDGCATTKVVHFGEHGCSLSSGWTPGERVIVAVAPEPGKTTQQGWCVDDLAWDGVARAIRRVAPDESAPALLRGFGCMP